MSIEVPVLDVAALGDRLRAVSHVAHEAAARLGPVDGTGDLAAAVGDFQECFGMAARALAVETHELGDAVEAVARSWAALDGGLLARAERVGR